MTELAHLTHFTLTDGSRWALPHTPEGFHLIKHFWRHLHDQNLWWFLSKSEEFFHIHHAPFTALKDSLRYYLSMDHTSIEPDPSSQTVLYFLGLHPPLEQADAVTKATKFIRVLVGHGAEIDRHSGDGKTPLNLAVRERQWIYFQALINNGADIGVANNDDAMTVYHQLMLPAQWTHPSMMHPSMTAQMFERLQSIDVRDIHLQLDGESRHWSHYAAIFGVNQILAQFCQYQFLDTYHDARHLTQMHYAVLFGATEAITILAHQCGHDVGVESLMHGMRPIHLLASQGDNRHGWMQHDNTVVLPPERVMETIVALQEAGEDINIRASDYTPLHLAVLSGKSYLVLNFLEAGADPNDGNGVSMMPPPLFFAAYLDSARQLPIFSQLPDHQAIFALLKYGAATDYRVISDAGDSVPLHDLLLDFDLPPYLCTLLRSCPTDEVDDSEIRFEHVIPDIFKHHYHTLMLALERMEGLSDTWAHTHEALSLDERHASIDVMQGAMHELWEAQTRFQDACRLFSEQEFEEKIEFEEDSDVQLSLPAICHHEYLFYNPSDTVVWIWGQQLDDYQDVDVDAGAPFSPWIHEEL